MASKKQNIDRSRKVRERTARAGVSSDDGADRSGRAWLHWARQRPKDALVAAVAAAATLTILINALFMQTGPHPAPIFANKPPAHAVPVPAESLLLPRATPVDLGAASRPRSEIIVQIQRELSRRGFYDGAADGVYGPATDSAIRDFEEAAGLRPSAEPNDVLLATLSRSQIKARAVPAGQRPDPIAELLAPSRRVIAVQRALTDFGYGQIKANGIEGPETQAAIRRFEQERRLPSTGKITERLTRELTAMTGRPID
jgi:peptidoglycan hydrolase-like protein with peptidoglycan-binding domain